MAMSHEGPVDILFLMRDFRLAAALEEEESGWKYIHGDVFRFPPLKNLFCAFIGTGTQVCAGYSFMCEGVIERTNDPLP